MNLRTRRQLIVSCIAPLAAACSVALHLPYWTSLLTFLLAPAALLTVWEPRHVGRAARYALALLPLGIVVDIVLHMTRQWWVSSASPLRLFGVMPVEDIAWSVLYIYVLVLAYEHFWDTHSQKPNRRFSFFVVIWLLLLAVCLTILIHAPVVIAAWPYAYLTMGLVILGGPLLLTTRVNPNLIPRFVHFGLFFIPYIFIYEITALHLGWWSFPGVYTGWISIGGFAIPLDELIVWFVLGATGFIALYEYFADDNR